MTVLVLTLPSFITYGFNDAEVSPTNHIAMRYPSKHIYPDNIFPFITVAGVRDNPTYVYIRKHLNLPKEFVYDLPIIKLT